MKNQSFFAGYTRLNTRAFTHVALVGLAALATRCGPSGDGSYASTFQGIRDRDGHDDDEHSPDGGADGGRGMNCRAATDDDDVLGWEQSVREGRARLRWWQSGQRNGPQRLIFQSATGVEIRSSIRPSERVALSVQVRVDQHSVELEVSASGTVSIEIDRHPIVTPGVVLGPNFAAEMQRIGVVRRDGRPALLTLRNIEAELSQYSRLLQRLSTEYNPECRGHLDDHEAQGAYAPTPNVTRGFGPRLGSPAYLACITPTFPAYLLCAFSAAGVLAAAFFGGPIVAIAAFVNFVVQQVTCLVTLNNATLACLRLPAVCPVRCNSANVPSPLQVPTGCCEANQVCLNDPQDRCRLAMPGPLCGGSGTFCNFGDVCFTPVRSGVADRARCCDVGNGTTQICQSRGNRIRTVSCCDDASVRCNANTGQCCPVGTSPNTELCCLFTQIELSAPNGQPICCEQGGEIVPAPGQTGQFNCCSGARGQAGGYCPNGANQSTASGRGGCCSEGTICRTDPRQDIPPTACCPASAGEEPRICKDRHTCCHQINERCVDELLFVNPLTGEERYQSTCVPSQ